MSIKESFESFMKSDFENAVDQSTKASWGGSGYSVELFDDGTYRVLWNNDIGNLYVSSGLIIGVPTLGDGEWNDDKDLRFYENAESEMMVNFETAIKDRN